MGPVGQVGRAESVRDLDAEAIVAEEDVADARDEQLAAHGAAAPPGPASPAPASPAPAFPTLLPASRADWHNSQSTLYIVVWASWMRCTELDGATNRWSMLCS